MQHILAIAVGQGSHASGSVVRDVIASKHAQEMRPYVTGLISGLEKLGLRGGQDFDIDEPRLRKDLMKLSVKEVVYTPTAVTKGVYDDIEALGFGSPED